MARNLGKMWFETAVIEGKPYGVPYAEGSDVLWRDHAPQTEGCIYLVVGDDGLIIGAGPDPAWNLIAGYDIWEVEGTDYKSAPGKHWDGEKIT
jgi:hypothetical protein